MKKIGELLGSIVLIVLLLIGCFILYYIRLVNGDLIQEVIIYFGLFGLGYLVFKVIKKFKKK